MYLDAHKILENYIYKDYDMNIEQFSQFLADDYISDKHQKEIFLRKGVWLKVKLNYIAALILTRQGSEIFSPKDIRDTIRKEVIPSLIEIPDSQLSGMLLTQDVHLSPKNPKWHNGYPCLQKVDRGKYKFIGFIN